MIELVATVVSSLFLVAAVFAATFVLSKHQSVAVLRNLPGPKPNFLFGNALQLARLPDEFMKQILGFTKQFQKEGLICIWLGPVYPMTLLFKPEYAEILLSTSKHMGKSFDYSFLHPWLGTGLLTSDGSKWRSRRRLITPTFHFRILNDFIQVFEEQAAILVKHLEKEVNGGVFNIMPYITRCALDVICITSMDASPNAQEDVDSPYMNAVLGVSELIQMRQRSPWLWNDTLYGLLPSGREHKRCLKVLHDFTNKVIDQRIADRASIKSKTQEEKEKEEIDEDDGVYKRKKRLAFLDLLLESYDTGDISREGVREEVDTFMFEGHDTTAAAITWALYLLGRHPVIQQKVHEEVDSFLEKRPETLAVDDLKDLRYLECIIKEALRLFPSVPFFARTTTEDFHMDGYTAPKGTSVGVATLALHRNSDVWPAPLEFNPDRFLPENSQGRHPFAYIPFSAGPRNCIGQRFAFLEEKIVLCHVMRNFSIESTQTFDDLRTCGELVTRPKEGIFVTLAKRF